MHNIMVIGDSHGDIRFIEERLEDAARQGCRFAIQLGDFGFWPDADGELDLGFLRAVSDSAVALGITLYVIDGNHDWHDAARQMFPIREQGLRPIYPNVVWADRGAVFGIGEIMFGALGGAISADRDQRQISFDTEGTTRDDLEALRRNQALYAPNGINVLLTHDAPGSCVVPGVSALGGDTGFAISENRQILAEAVSEFSPDNVWHGHYHFGHRTVIDRGNGLTRVQGYASNVENDPSSYGVWDLDSLGNPYQSIFGS